MRKTFAILALLFAVPAWAHVALTTPYSVSGPPGVATCSAPHMTATGYAPIINAGVLTGVTITYSLGTATFSGGIDSTWVTSGCAPTYVFTLNFSSGQWTLSANGGNSLSGVMTGATLSTALSNYQTEDAVQFADTADQFLTVTGSGLLATAFGTQPDLWHTGDN